MLTNILSVLSLIPRILDLFNTLAAYIKEKNLEAWVSDLETTVDNLKKAQTPQDKLAAASSIADLIRKLQ